MTRRRLVALMAAVALALPFLQPAVAQAAVAHAAEPVPPAPNLTARVDDMGGGYYRIAWVDTSGAVYDLGEEGRIPSPKTVPGIAIPVVYTGDPIDRAAAANRVSAAFLHCLAGRESGHDPGAVNQRGNWHGTFQYLPSTWSSQSARYGYRGAGIYDGVAQAHVTAAAIADHRGDVAWLRGQWPPSAFCGSPWA
jgi:hypothetical protein